MGKTITKTTSTVLHADIERWIAEQPTNPEMEQRRRDLETATARVADLRSEQTAAQARHGDVDREMLSVATEDRPPLHRELIEIESELRVLVRLVETAEADRIRAWVVALARVDALIVAELGEIQAFYRQHMPTLRGVKTPEGQEKVRPTRQEKDRLQQREERLESIQRLVRHQVRQVGEEIDVANERTWDAPVTKAAARAMRVAA